MKKSDPLTLALVSERKRLTAKLRWKLANHPRDAKGQFGLRCKINATQKAISIYHRVIKQTHENRTFGDEREIGID